jgi:hypothetical protein
LNRLAAPLLLCLSLLVGCDDPSAVDVELQPDSRNARPTTADFTIIAALPANRVTRLTLDRGGKPYWTQHDPEREAIVFTLDERGLPRPTALNAARVLQLINARDGRGQFVALLGDSTGGVLFHFVGRDGLRPISLIGRYRPPDGDISVVVDTATLQSVTSLGPSLVNARSELLNPSAPMLWLFTLDASMLLRIDTVGGQLTVPRIENARGRPLGGEHDEWQACTADGTLWLLDASEPRGGVAGPPRLMRVGRSGRVTRDVELPADADYPANPVRLTRAADALLVFAVERPTHRPPRLGGMAQPAASIEFPAFLLVEESGIIPISRDKLRMPASLPVQTLRITALVCDPRDDSLVAYDAASGYLLRIVMK